MLAQNAPVVIIASPDHEVVIDGEDAPAADHEVILDDNTVVPPTDTTPADPTTPSNDVTKLADTVADQQAIVAVAFVMLTLGAVVLARRLA